MTTTIFGRAAADSFLAQIDSFTRAALPDAGAPADPEEAKERILAGVREDLGWDGTTGDPNASLAALEDALGDMFDAHVDIVFDGVSQLTMQVEGEEPVILTPDYLGDLLEELARGGQDGDEGADDEGGADEGDDEADQADEGDAADDPERGYVAAQMRSGVLDTHGHLHASTGIHGGQFVSKGGGGGGAAKAAKKAVKVAGKPAAKPGANKPAVSKPSGKAPGASGPSGHSGPGPHPANLAKRAKGRAGPRATSKAVGETLSAGTGNRVRVSGQPDGSFEVGPQKKKMSGKKVGIAIVATWLVFNFAVGFLQGMSQAYWAG